MKKKLSTIEASAIITGYGLGSGILAMPFIVSKCGYGFGLGIIALAFIFSYLLHLMIADLSIKSGADGQVMKIISTFMSKKYNKALNMIVYILLAIVLFSNLAIYICGASDILLSLFHMNTYISKLVFYLFAAIVAIFGLKILGICEKYAILSVILLLIVLSIASMFHRNASIPFEVEEVKSLLSFFGVVMFSFAAFFSVPQVVDGLNGDKKKIKKSIFIGMLINATLMIIFITFSLLVSKEQNEVGIISWTQGIGKWAEIVGAIFTLLAMLTSYWSISLALKDITSEATGLNPKISYFIATVPSLLIALIPIAGFISFLEITSGAVAVLIILFLIPMFHKSRKDGESILGRFACLFVEMLVLIAYLGMALGSIL